MATLEKIRNKSVFLIVVIGIALLAFIVGDAISNGRTLFGNGSTVASIGDAKVDISEYQQRLNMLQEGNPDADSQLLSQAALEQLLNEKLLDNAAKEMGIAVSDEQTSFYIMDQPLEPMQMFMNTYGRSIQQLFPNAQPTPQLMYNVIFTPEKYNLTPDQVSGLKQAWLAMESQTKAAIARNLYVNLLAKTIQPNALDKKDLFAMNAQSYTVDVARKPFGELDPKKYPVSEAELKAEYEKRKNFYRMNEPGKTVGFIAYEVKPSEADVKMAKELQTSALALLKAGKPLSKDLTKEGVRYDRTTASASNVQNPQIANFLKSAAVDTVAVFDRGGSFDIVKLVKITSANDSIELDVLQVQKEQVAGVTADLKAGVPADSLAAKYADKVMAQPTQWIQAQNPQMRTGIPQSFAAALDTVAAGAVLTVDSSDQGSVLAYVKSVKPKVPVYEFEDVSYELYPSQETVDAATTALTKYAATNNTPAKFGDNAQKAGYQYQSIPVSASVPAIPAGMNPMNGQRSYYPHSSKVIEWVMTKAEPGSVSEVFDNEDAQAPVLYIAMVENEYDDFAPYTDSLVKKDLENRIRRSKAGDAMVKQYSGKADINATAQAMGVPVVTDSQLRFLGSNNVADAKVAARMTGTKPGTKVYVVKGDDGVYAYVMKAANPVTTKPYEDQQMQQYNGAFKSSINNIMNMLRGNRRVENHIFEMTGGR